MSPAGVLEPGCTVRAARASTAARGPREFGAAQVAESALQFAGPDEAVEQRVPIVARQGRAQAGEQLLPELLGAQAFASFAEDEQVPGRLVVGGAKSFERSVHKIVNPLERDDAGADAQLWIDGEENILFSGSHSDGQPEESRLEPQRLFQTEEFCTAREIPRH